MKAVSDQDISEAVRSMLAAGMTFPSSMDPETAPSIYAFAVKNVSVVGFKTAVKKLVRGEYENIAKAFIPTPPELAAMARLETRMIADDLARAKLKLESLAPPTAARVDEAMRERVKEKIRQFRAENEMRKDIERGYSPHMPLSPERQEYWEKIAALQDAPEVNAEQQAFRRKIEMQMSISEIREAAE